MCSGFCVVHLVDSLFVVEHLCAGYTSGILLVVGIIGQHIATELHVASSHVALYVYYVRLECACANGLLLLVKLFILHSVLPPTDVHADMRVQCITGYSQSSRTAALGSALPQDR